ncbi:MAG: DUF2155 domain-containing protein [Rhizobiaceae bacterium]
MLAICAVLIGLLPTHAQRISNRVAVFTGIDKITGDTHTFDVYINETVKFGQLEITPKVCYSRPATEEPKTTSFVEVDEITLDRRIRRIFTGWMFAESPGLNAVEHPINDVWLVTCKQTSDIPAPPGAPPIPQEEPPLINDSIEAESAVEGNSILQLQQFDLQPELPQGALSID